MNEVPYHTHNGTDGSPQLDASVIGSGTFSTDQFPTIPVSKGGTGQTTANDALNALLPSQTSNSGKYLTTDGTDTSWGSINTAGNFEAGVVPDFSTTTTANSDVQVTFATGTFTPTFIKLYYFIQGYDGGNVKYAGRKGIACYKGTTLAYDFCIWGANNGSAFNEGGSMLTGDDGKPDNLSAFENNPNRNTPPVAGKSGGGGDTKATFSILTTFAGGFTIRRSSTVNASNPARYKFAYEAYA